MAVRPLRLIAPLLAMLLAACATAPFPRGEPSSALPAAESTELDRAVTALALAPDQSAYRLIDGGEDGFAARMQSAALAERSLDVQYYLWHKDLTGLSIAGELLRAADRGVRVRILVDDITARGMDTELANLDAHERIEIRIFNPFRTRGSTLGNALEFLGGRVNHRMHNKLWIADSRVAVIGGRNLGDEYFGAHQDVNFGDLGVLVAGHVVADATAGFDEYWNGDSVVPVSAFAHAADADAAAAKARASLEAQRETAKQSPYAARLFELRNKGALGLRLDSMMRGTNVRMIADDPSKSKGGDAPLLMLDAIRALLESAQREAVIVSPYFVPRQAGTDALLAMRARGVAVSVLTNSLAANDVASVHGGYTKWRLDLLRSGVGIHELKPVQDVPKDAPLGSSNAALHAKSVIVDQRVAFIGSFNMDPRSARINTEAGVVIDDPAFAAALHARYDLTIARARSWELALDDGHVVWLDEIDGQPVTLRDEPQASTGKRFIAWLFRLLPLDSQL